MAGSWEGSRWQSLSNCLPGAAHLAASGSPADILHSLPLPRPRRELPLAHAYQHLQLTHTSLSLPQLRGAAAHLTPSQTPTRSPPPGHLLRVLPSSFAPPHPHAAKPSESGEGARRAAPGFLGPGRGWSRRGTWPGQARGALGRRHPLWSRLGHRFTSSLSHPSPAPSASWFQTFDLTGHPSSFLEHSGIYRCRSWSQL